MRQVICNKCGNIINPFTEEEYNKAKNPRGYEIEIVGLGIDNEVIGWRTFKGHLCRECKQEIVKVFLYDLEKHDC